MSTPPSPLLEPFPVSPPPLFLSFPFTSFSYRVPTPGSTLTLSLSVPPFQEVGLDPKPLLQQVLVHLVPWPSFPVSHPVLPESVVVPFPWFLGPVPEVVRRVDGYGFLSCLCKWWRPPPFVCEVHGSDNRVGIVYLRTVRCSIDSYRHVFV